MLPLDPLRTELATDDSVLLRSFLSMRRKIPRPALIGGLSILIVRKGPFNAYRAYYDHDRKEFVYLEYQHPVLGEPRRVQVNASPRGAGVE